MSNFSDIKKGLSNYEMLERELTLKQLQINRLLDITQAINNNLPSIGLFKMYSSFLSWEMGVKKMALFIREEDKTWCCATSIGIDEMLLTMDITERLSKFERLNNISDDEHPLINQFDVVIPVKHKKEAISYVFIGGFGENEDIFNKVQFITTITNIVAVAIENKRLFRQQIEQERLGKEMELASTMQNMLVPSDLPSNEQFELASIYKPHLGVGGDYFDFIDYDDPRFAFCIGDISGKGLAAALLMANFQASLRSLINRRIKAKPFIEQLNTAVFEAAKGGKFITFFIGEFNLITRELIYVNAGHNPPALITEGKLIKLDRGCTILGAFEEIPEIEVGSLIIEKEALIVTFTDGLSDVQNSAGEYFNEESLYDFALNNCELSAKGFNDTLLEHIDEYRGDQPFPDDFSVLTCKIFK